MRPVARIAQSVEQGIENPVSWFDSESGHHLFKEPDGWFCFLQHGLFIELRSIIRNAPLTFGASATSALFNACGVGPSPGTTYLKKPA